MNKFLLFVTTVSMQAVLAQSAFAQVHKQAPLPAVVSRGLLSDIELEKMTRNAIECSLERSTSSVKYTLARAIYETNVNRLKRLGNEAEVYTPVEPITVLVPVTSNCINAQDERLNEQALLGLYHLLAKDDEVRSMIEDFKQVDQAKASGQPMQPDPFPMKRKWLPPR